MTAIEQVLFVTRYKVVSNFTSVKESLMCDHSDAAYRGVHSCGAQSLLMMLYKVPLKFTSVDETLVCNLIGF